MPPFKNTDYKMVEEQFRQIIMTLKLKLKERKISYTRLAKDIGLSESSIKKLFISKDCTIGKILLLCDYLKIDPVEVLQYSLKKENQKITINKSTQNFFDKNFDYYVIFWLLSHDRLSPEEIRASYGITENQLNQVIEKLIQFKLISYDKTNNLKVPHHDNFEYTELHEFLEKRDRIVSNDLCKRAIYPKDENDNVSYNILNIKLQKEDFYNFNRELDFVLEKYRLKSVEERNTYSEKELVNYSFFYALFTKLHKKITNRHDGKKLLKEFA